jgi:DNA repair protein RAD50
MYVLRLLRSYETRGGAAELAKCERDLKQHDAVIGDTKARITTLQTQIASADKRLADSSAVLRNFNDNLRLRSERKNLTAIDDELEGLDDEGARKAYRKYETDYNVQRKKQTDRQAAVSLSSWIV